MPITRSKFRSAELTRVTSGVDYKDPDGSQRRPSELLAESRKASKELSGKAVEKTHSKKAVTKRIKIKATRSSMEIDITNTRDPATSKAVDDATSEFVTMDSVPLSCSSSNPILEGKSLLHLLDVLNDRQVDGGIEPDLAKHSASLTHACSMGYLNPTRDAKLLHKILEQNCIDLMEVFVKNVDYLPEWFLRRCLAAAASEMNSAGKYSVHCGSLLQSISRREFDRKKILMELKKCPFSSILIICQRICDEMISDTITFEEECRIFSWVSAFVESHLTEYVLAEDAYPTLFRIRTHCEQTIDDLFLNYEVQGQIQALLQASKDADRLSKENLKYWHDAIEF